MTDPALEKVLDAFAVEPSPGRETLERYLRRYPQFAPALIDLSRELHREVPGDAGPETAEDEARIDAAWRRHLAAGRQAAHLDPFAALSTDELRNLAKALDVPRQVLTAFRDGKVLLASVPRRFLARLAVGLNTSLDAILPALPLSAALAPRSHKADVKPSDSEPVTFERLLVDAGVPEEKRARLLAEAD
jgi:hypothetical protein